MRSSDATLRSRRERLAQGGYNLVALMVLLVVLNVAVAAAMPLWSGVMQREREAELLFRGWQYAEAIRVFQARFGRYPVRLEELIEVEPRCIRQLWTDPLSETGEWELILAGAGQQLVPGGEGDEDERPQGRDLGGGRAPAGGVSFSLSPSRDAGRPSAFTGARPGSGAAASGGELGPIEGVRPTATGTALKVFMGRTEYSQWEFRASMTGGSPVTAEGVPRSPRIGADGVSRSLPESAAPQAGTPSSPVPNRNPLDGG